MPRWYLAVLVFSLPYNFLIADEIAGHPKDPRVIDAQLRNLDGFRTVETAVATRISRAEPNANDVPAQPAYLGVNAEPNAHGQLVVQLVEPSSPAEKAGVTAGDLLLEAAGHRAEDAGQLGDLLRAKAPGDPIKLVVQRERERLELTAKLAATSRPLSANGPRLTLGIMTSEAADGVRIDRIVADAANTLKVGDIIRKLDDAPVSNPQRLSAVLAEKKAGEPVALVVQREGKEVVVRVPVTAAANFDRNRMGWDERSATIWKKDVYRLAVVPIEYPDVKHNAKFSLWDWEQALFSRGTYLGKNPTGQQVYGSMNDYYLEQSCGTFHVDGKAFDWVPVSKERAKYAEDRNRFALLTEALDKLLARDGKNALDTFDGIFFIYAGDRFQTNRGNLYWPHRSSFSHNGRRWAYYICPEGGGRFSSISVVSHEFGHMLGLPDLYAKPESPGSEGLGIWCTMSVGHGQDGKPLHMCAWVKEQMGWLKPTVIDPSVKQKLVLSPIEGSPKECFKILIRPDGSEYLLLENRAARGYDRDLPADGLLIWRVVDGRPVLEESHGIAGPQGPDRFLGSVPYPSGSNNAFTPYTTPSSRSLKGGGVPVYVTNINRLPDGRVTFFVGYEYF